MIFFELHDMDTDLDYLLSIDFCSYV